jgi:hypothetical protein
MFKKIIIAVLILTVLGAGAAALTYRANAQSEQAASSTPQPLASNATDNGQLHHATDEQLTQSGQAIDPQEAAAQNGQAGNVEPGDGTHTPDPQAQVDEWVILEGTLMSFQGGTMTMATASGDLATFQTGQPRFLAGQGVTFQVGDQVSVLGFYEDGQFMAGEITQTSTGLRVMLRDPNGRPLWAGPGSGNGDGNNNGGANGANGNSNHGKNS